MSAPRRESETVNEMFYPFETDEVEGKIVNRQRQVKREYADGTKTSDFYSDYTIKKPDGGSYTWHASLHHSGKCNLDLITPKGTFHQHELQEGTPSKFKTSFWEKPHEK